VVLVVVDTLRRDRLASYGFERDTSPFLTRLARRGVVFERAQSVSSWTAPATASLLTSLHPLQHGVTSGLMATRRLQRRGQRVRLNRIPEAAETLAELMARAGHATFGLTLNPNVSGLLGFDQGFARFRNLPREDRAEDLNKRLFNWSERIRRAAPYFLYLHYLDPHEPYYENAPWFDRTTRGEARTLSAYDSEVSYFDRHFERAWTQLGWDRDTLVIVTADHGESFGEHGQQGHGGALHAELLDVPLLMVFPDGRGAGRRVAARVSHLDVLPTLAALLGVEPAREVQGLSLLAAIDGAPGAQGAPRAFFAHLRRQEPGRPVMEQHAVTQGDLKLIVGGPRGRLLFDLARDPGERTNLAAAREDDARRLESRLAAFRRDLRSLPQDEGEVDLDAETQERLRALGYVR
jgi:arylsulfatase A-like enzyme